MLAGEGGEFGAALLHGLELAAAVGVQRPEVAGELRREVGEREGCRVERLEDRREGGIVGGDASDRAARGIHEADGVAAVGVELGRDDLVCLGGGEPQVFEVAQALGALPQLDVLAALRGDGLDLLDREPQVLGLAGAAVALGDEHVELGGAVLPAAEGILIVAEQHTELGAGEAVERLALGGRRAQPQLVGLPVHDDELPTDLVENADRGARGRRRRRGCDPPTRPTGRG